MLKYFLPIMSALSLSLMQEGEAVVLITVNSFDSTSIDVTVSGTIDAINVANDTSLWWGFDNGGDNSWIDDSALSATNTITDLGGASWVPSSFGNADENGGGFFFASSNDTNDFIQVGDTVNFRSVTTQAVFDWSQFNPNQLVIQAGVIFDPANFSAAVIGGNGAVFTGGAAIPEPSSVFLLPIGALAFIGLRCRKS